MPKILCFCVCDRAGTDISEIGKNQAKKDKNEHEFGKRVKSQSRGSKLPLFSSDCQNTPCGITKGQNYSLYKKFAKLAEMVPQVWKIDRNGP